jgi:hypothetical protein
MKLKQYRNITGWIVAVWFILASVASALRLFENESNRFGLAVAFSAMMPLVVFAFWYTASESFREFALSLNAAGLTFAQSWRIAGFVFILLHAYGVLPAVFALPAGYGDVAIGATAPLVAWKLARPRYRNSFIVWQVLGIADLLMAVSLGTTAGLLKPHSIPMTVMTVLPLSLVPTFIVPLLLIFHFICIAQARHWTSSFGDRVQIGKPVDELGGGGSQLGRVA